jgi:hypothetical protein
MTENEILQLTLDELTSLWVNDSKIDFTEVGQESVKTGTLHAKYLKIMAIHTTKHREALRAMAKIRNLRQSYYDGSIDKETEKKYNWKPFPYKVLKGDMERFMEGDEFVQKASSLVAKHEDIIEICKSIIKELGNRSYQLKAAVDWQRLMAGFNT